MCDRKLYCSVHYLHFCLGTLPSYVPPTNRSSFSVDVGEVDEMRNNGRMEGGKMVTSIMSGKTAHLMCIQLVVECERHF